MAPPPLRSGLLRPSSLQRLVRLREALRKRAGAGWRRWRCHVRVTTAATATVARDVEEVGLALTQHPDPVLCTRVGEESAGPGDECRLWGLYRPTAKMKLDETPMFDPALLQEVDWSQNTATFSPAISPAHPGEGLVLRPLCTADLNRGFLKVLGQLTETGVVSPEQFMKSFEHMKKSGDYYVTVVEDVTLGQIVATATLIVEHKFIHSCAKRGRVEDVVVSDECRGKQLGKLLLSTLTLLSKKLNCYKITLECLPQNVGFYKKFGYTVSEENYMCRRFLK